MRVVRGLLLSCALALAACSGGAPAGQGSSSAGSIGTGSIGTGSIGSGSSGARGSSGTSSSSASSASASASSSTAASSASSGSGGVTTSASSAGSGSSGVSGGSSGASVTSGSGGSDSGGSTASAASSASGGSSGSGGSATSSSGGSSGGSGGADAGLPDAGPLLVLDTTPRDGATGVSPFAGVSATFNQDLDPATGPSSLSIAGVSGSIAYKASSDTVVLTPNAPLAWGTGYTATVSGGTRSITGAQLAAPVTFTFTTMAKPAEPVVMSATPADGQHFVATSASITATFSEPLLASTVNTNTFQVGGLAGTVSYDAATYTATFTASSPLPPGATLTATLTTGIQSSGGTPMAGTYRWSFRTLPVATALEATTRAKMGTPVFAFDGAGNGLALWTMSPGGTANTELLWSHYSAAAGTWSAEAVLEASTYASGAIDVVGLTSGFAAAWTSESPFGTRAGYFDGSTWAAKVNLNTTGKTQLVANGTQALLGVGPGAGYPVSLAVFDGASWTTSSSPQTWVDKFAIAASASGFGLATDASENLEFSSWSGGAWSSPTLVSSQVSNYDLALASNGSGWALAWTDPGGTTDLAGYASVFDGTRWSTPAAVADCEWAGSDLTLTSNGTGYALACYDSITNANAQAAVYANGAWQATSLGSYFSGPIQLASDGSGYAVAFGSGYPTHPEVAVYENGAWTATALAGSGSPSLVGSRASGYAVIYASSGVQVRRYASSTWQPAEQLDTGAGPVFTPALAVDGAGFGAGWPQGGGVEFSLFDGSSWSAAVDAVQSAHPGTAYTPLLAVGPSGQAEAMWYQYDLGAASIYGAVDPGSGWSAPFQLSSSGTADDLATDGTHFLFAYETGSAYVVDWTGGSASAPVKLNTNFAGNTHLTYGSGRFMATWTEGSSAMSATSPDGDVWAPAGALGQYAYGLATDGSDFLAIAPSPVTASVYTDAWAAPATFGNDVYLQLAGGDAATPGFALISASQTTTGGVHWAAYRPGGWSSGAVPLPSGAYYFYNSVAHGPGGFRALFAAGANSYLGWLAPTGWWLSPNSLPYYSSVAPALASDGDDWALSPGQGSLYQELGGAFRSVAALPVAPTKFLGAGGYYAAIWLTNDPVSGVPTVYVMSRM